MAFVVLRMEILLSFLQVSLRHKHTCIFLQVCSHMHTRAHTHKHTLCTQLPLSWEPCPSSPPMLFSFSLAVMAVRRVSLPRNMILRYRLSIGWSSCKASVFLLTHLDQQLLMHLCFHVVSMENPECHPRRGRQISRGHTATGGRLASGEPQWHTLVTAWSPPSKASSLRTPRLRVLLLSKSGRPRRAGLLAACAPQPPKSDPSPPQTPSTVALVLPPRDRV